MIVVCVLLHDYVNVRVCNLHNPHRTGHIENHKQHSADLQLVALFPQSVYTANRVFIVMVPLYCVKGILRKKNWILRFERPKVWP